MKLSKLAASFAALTLATSGAFGADTTNTSDHQWLVDASKLDGTAVFDFHGHKLGDLQKVLIDPKSGRIRYGVMEVDKSWNWNDPTVAIPWGTFAVKKGDDKMPNLSIDATKDKLEKAPKFKEGDADRLFGKEASAPIYTYWSIYWFDEPMPATQKDATGNKSKSPSSKTGSDAADTSTPADSTK